MTILSVKNITKSFGNTHALKGVSFDVDEGEIVALLGPSGCGKSTLLFTIAGLESPDDGEIWWNGNRINDVPPHRRGFGLMFQDFALFPHMNVYANIAFGLKMTRTDPGAINPRIREVLDLVGLHSFEKRDVNTLSGGEQQRVALARALAPHPHLLMLDEPLGSLDSNLRERLVADLHDILKIMHQTAIYVTHDQEEAFTIADRVILMNAGKIEQNGTPQEIYSNPASIFVARFLEMTNILPGTVETTDGVHQVVTSVGNFQVTKPVEGKVSLLIRPDMARLDGDGTMTLTGLLKEVSFRGSNQRITILVNQNELTFDISSMTVLPKPGAYLTLRLDPSSAIKIFPA